MIAKEGKKEENFPSKGSNLMRSLACSQNKGLNKYQRRASQLCTGPSPPLVALVKCIKLALPFLYFQNFGSYYYLYSEFFLGQFASFLFVYLVLWVFTLFLHSQNTSLSFHSVEFFMDLHIPFQWSEAPASTHLVLSKILCI